MADQIAAATTYKEGIEAELQMLSAAAKSECVLSVGGVSFAVPPEVVAPIIARLIEAKTAESRAIAQAIDTVMACAKVLE